LETREERGVDLQSPKPKEKSRTGKERTAKTAEKTRGGKTEKKKLKCEDRMVHFKENKKRGHVQSKAHAKRQTSKCKGGRGTTAVPGAKGREKSWEK